MDNQENNTINTLRINLEELEKRIKSLEKQLTATQLATSLSACLTEIKTNLQEILTEYNTIATNYTAHLAEYTSHATSYTTFANQTTSALTTNSTDHQTMQSSITSHTQSLATLILQAENLQNSLTTLSSRVSSLESQITGGGSGGGSSVITTGEVNSIVSFEDKFVSTRFNNTIKSTNKYFSQKVSFVADLSSYTSVELKIFGTTTNTNTSFVPRLIVMLNGITIHTENLQSYTNTDFVVNFEKQLVLSAKSNYIQFCFEATQTFTIHNFELKINGVNAKIVSRDRALAIYPCINKYFICDRRDPTCIKYGVIPKANLTSISSIEGLSVLSETSLIENLCDVNYYPIFKLDYPYNTLNVDYYVNGGTLICFRNIENMNVKMSEINTSLTPPLHYKIDACDLSTIYFDYYHANVNGTGYIIYYITGNTVKGYANTTPNKNFYITYNSANITNAIKVAAVKSNNSITENGAGYTKYGLIVQDINKNLTYYPAINSTYKIDLGVGDDMTAYYQNTSNKINVYITNGCVITKYTLSYNSSSMQYVKDDLSVQMYGLTRYEELYDNKALAYKLNDVELLENQTF